jgi:hypothetical protein
LKKLVTTLVLLTLIGCSSTYYPFPGGEATKTGEGRFFVYMDMAYTVEGEPDPAAVRARVAGFARSQGASYILIEGEEAEFVTSSSPAIGYAVTDRIAVVRGGDTTGNWRVYYHIRISDTPQPGYVPIREWVNGS